MILVWRSLRGVDNSFPLEHNSSFNNHEKKKLEINMSAKLLCPPGAASPSIPIQLFKSGSWVSWVFSAALNPTRGNGCEVASWRVPLNTRLEHNNCPKQQLHKQPTKKNSIEWNCTVPGMLFRCWHSTLYLSILVHHCTIRPVKSTPKSALICQIAQFGPIRPKFCVPYAKKYTGLKKVHHRRLWLIWATLFPFYQSWI